MNEPLLDRIAALERSVRRWRVVSFCLALLLLCSLAIGGTTLGLMMNLPGQFDFLMPWARERAAREEAEMARQEAIQAMHEAEAARKQAQDARKELLRDADAARKQKED
jgi:hypothetical protein